MKHTCHAEGCEKRIVPSLFMCAKHWGMLSLKRKVEVWKHYREGQERDKAPSREYLEAARQAINEVREKEQSNGNLRRDQV